MKRRDTTDELDAPETEPSRLRRAVEGARYAGDSLVGFFAYAVDSTVGSAISFCRMWLTSRPLPALALGLPAVVVAITAVVLAGVVRHRASGLDVLARYRDAGTDAMERGDVEAANLWSGKAALAGAAVPDFQFHLAMVAADQGDLQKTREILARIAPRDRVGHAEAHFWLARDLIERELTLTPDMAERIDHHLQCSLASDRARGPAQAMLGQLCVMQQDWERAIEHFTKAARSNPSHYMTLSKLYRSLNRPERARHAARIAGDHFRGLAESDRENWQVFLQWSLCELLEEDLVTAARILEAIRDRVDDPKPVHQALVLAYLGLFDKVVREDPDDMVKQLELLNQALAYGPEHPRVLATIASLSSEDPTPTEQELSQQLNEALQRSLAAGVAPATVHLILGTRHLVIGETDKAVMHLELAHQANAHVPSVLNNLAWGLAHRDEPDLERAMTLIDTAAKLSDRPQIRGTRAVILELMGQDREAVTELENVLPSHPDPAWVHLRLADLYVRLGDEGLAAEHRRLAARKKSDESDSPSH